MTPTALAPVRGLARTSLKDKLLLTIPLPIGCYLLVRGLLEASGPSADPLYSMVTGVSRWLVLAQAAACFYLSLRTYLKIRHSHG